MAYRDEKITEYIKKYDDHLFAKRDGLAIRIYRKTRDVFGDSYHLVMSLTDTWGMTGRPVDWGIEPILARLRALDLWQSDNLSQQFFKDEERLELEKEREFRNTTESFLYDFKKQFARATNDINTSCMPNFDKRRLKS